MSNQKQGFSAAETAVINVLKNLDAKERITFEQLSKHLGINRRSSNNIVESLRIKGYQIVASRKQDDLGIRFAIDQAEWNEYVQRRQREVQNRMNALGEL